MTVPAQRTGDDRAAAMSLRGLVKHFDTKLAVSGVSLDVPAGSFFGLLGPNGAGKTTTLSMAVGLLRPLARLRRCRLGSRCGPRQGGRAESAAKQRDA
jgi:ABC-type uncharacterized transport system ATPase subunit